MESEDIKQMFADSARLKKMGVFEKEYQEVSERFAKLSRQYRSEYIEPMFSGGTTEESNSDKQERRDGSPDWKGALQYIGGILKQMDAAVPESAVTNRSVWEIIAPAVQGFYDPKDKNQS